MEKHIQIHWNNRDFCALLCYKMKKNSSEKFSHWKLQWGNLDSIKSNVSYQRMFAQHVSLSSDKLLEVVHLLPALASIRANMFAYVLKPQNVFADSRMWKSIDTKWNWWNFRYSAMSKLRQMRLEEWRRKRLWISEISGKFRWAVRRRLHS